MKQSELLLAGVGVGLVLVMASHRAAAARIEDVAQARESASSTLTDFFAWITGLDAEQNRILEDPDYAKMYITLE